MRRVTRFQATKDDSDTREVTAEDTEDNEANMENQLELAEATEELTTAKAIMCLSNKMTEMKDEIKQELAHFKTEINQKLLNITADIRNQGTRLAESEQRIGELESANKDLRDALLHSVKQQKTLMTKMTDLEGRSRRNNLRVYNISENAEGSSMSSFMDTFLKRELSLREEEDLQIQRAHRSLGPKPQDKHAARSILVNFQRFDMKDKVLRAAWAKKIIFDGKVITFANDMPTEINNKMKEYKDIKKSLKEAKIRFQTPYPAKLRVHWEDGPRVYKTAKEAAEDARKRGLSVEIPRSSDTDWEQVLTRDTHWNKAGNTHTERVRERLRVFQND
ncbi:unnamed protein product [Knipowitschia caucasica]|uniref:L1 transposable element RRM domain-containing protein n=1 Tax=Knipowitschia caucasica TaxID=637954 RepID=A0AAV2L2W3_KNICA